MVLVGAVVAGRVGTDDELRNVAGVAVVGLAWPVLVVAALWGRDLWSTVDPWDAAARLLRAPETPYPADTPPASDAPPAPDVRPALPAAAAWTAYLALWPRPLDPRGLGAVLALYSIVTVAACAAVGRRRWLTRAEAVGVFLRLAARRHAAADEGLGGSPVGRRSPAGAAAFLGLVAGGLLAGGLRVSSVGASIAAGPGSALWRTAVFVACALTGALILEGLQTGAVRRVSRAAADGVVAAAAPGAAAIAVALALGSHRFTTSLQLLVSLVSDPLGAGWDLVGTAAPRPVWFPFADASDPRGLRGLAVVQVLVVLAGGITGVVAARRRVSVPRERGPAVAAAVVLATAGALTFSLR